MDPSSLQNIVVKYVVKGGSVPEVGDLTTTVEISREPVFESSKSLSLAFVTSDGLSFGTPSSISYASIRAGAYRNRISATATVSGEAGTVRRDFSAARNAVKKLLPQVIAEYEAMFGGS